MMAFNGTGRAEVAHQHPGIDVCDANDIMSLKILLQASEAVLRLKSFENSFTTSPLIFGLADSCSVSTVP